MITSKKRSLNEIRQTKDSYYVVPSTVTKSLTEQVIGDFFKRDSGQSTITIENYSELTDFLRTNRFIITKE
ncbi:MAG: hypothetical protein QNL43_04365 [Crocinitomicaceae bacterium]|tara:strand:+ start:3047 stop:3259 length:213 start_codon:yes stop_codon:yes gene_type:complete